jgi:hypothetical protein
MRAMRVTRVDPGARLVRDASTYFGRGRSGADRHVPARAALAVLGTAMALAGLAPLLPVGHSWLVVQLCGTNPVLCGVRLAAGAGLMASAATPEFAWARRCALAAGLLFGALALITGEDTGLQGIACVVAMGTWALTDAGMETAWLTSQQAPR